jgi:hypothetical protein
MNVPDWPWMVGGLFLLLIGIFLGVNIARVGERARHGGHESPPADERPRIGPKPKVDWGAINLDLSAPRSSDAAKDRTSF